MNNAKVIKLIFMYLSVLCIFAGVTYFCSETITVINDNKPIVNQTCVIIDAGHGGIDGGATSVSGVLESALNLEIALRLDDLMHLLGISTKMIRTVDESVHTEGDTISQIKISDLKNRVKIVNSTAGGILISIHQNYFSESKYYGPQVFYSKTEGSDELARIMQSSLVCNLTPLSKRKAKQSNNVYLMDKIEGKGILIECGFISNREEEEKLLSETYQKKLCVVIGSVISQYINEKPIA